MHLGNRQRHISSSIPPLAAVKRLEGGGGGCSWAAKPALATRFECRICVRRVKPIMRYPVYIGSSEVVPHGMRPVFDTTCPRCSSSRVKVALWSEKLGTHNLQAINFPTLFKAAAFARRRGRHSRCDGQASGLLRILRSQTRTRWRNRRAKFQILFSTPRRLPIQPRQFPKRLNGIGVPTLNRRQSFLPLPSLLPALAFTNSTDPSCAAFQPLETSAPPSSGKGASSARSRVLAMGTIFESFILQGGGWPAGVGGGAFLLTRKH